MRLRCIVGSIFLTMILFGNALAKASKEEEQRLAAEKGFANALDWLARHQAENGSWGALSFNQKCVGEKCTTPNNHENYMLGGSGMALLAFMNADKKLIEKHKKTITAVIKFLISKQAEDGAIGSKASYMYNELHSICTRAMAIALIVVEKNPELEIYTADVLKSSVSKAAGMLIKAQNPGFGWRYGVRPGDNDTFQTGMAVLALVQCRKAGIEIAEEVFDGAMKWFTVVTDKNHRCGFINKGGMGPRLAGSKCDPNEVMTAIGTACRLGMKKSQANDPGIVGGVNLFLKETPQWVERKIDFNMWHYGSLALKYASVNPEIKKKFELWQKTVCEFLLKNQYKDEKECRRGSWDALDQWGKNTGRVFSVAINAITLKMCFPEKKPEKKVVIKEKPFSDSILARVRTYPLKKLGSLLKKSKHEMTLRCVALVIKEDHKKLVKKSIQILIKRLKSKSITIRKLVAAALKVFAGIEVGIEYGLWKKWYDKKYK